MATIEVEVDEGTEVSAVVGDRVVLRLPENATTGYQWSAEPSEHVEVVASSLEPPVGAAPGAAGARVVRLRVVSPGEATVTLRLARQWETAAVQQRQVRLHLTTP